jgi:hypothetical protein
MGVRQLPDGTILADTPEELARYNRAMAGGAKTTVDGVPAEWSKFHREVSGVRYETLRKALGFVRAGGDIGVDRAEIAEVLEMEKQGVGGVFSGLTKLCQRVGLKPELVVTKEGSTYVAGELLKKYGVE